MYSHLLKKALPFTLTLVVGAALGGLFNPRGEGSPAWASWHGARREFGFGERRRRHACRMRRHHLVAETKPLLILFKPDASCYLGAGMRLKSVWVSVTFGADGKVQEVKHLDPLLPSVTLEKVERAARQIKFTPETVNGIPVTVEKNVEIHLITD